MLEWCSVWRFQSNFARWYQCGFTDEYIVTIPYDLRRTLASALIADCPPTANDDHSLVIQSEYGGYTFEALNYGSDVTPGAVVV